MIRVNVCLICVFSVIELTSSAPRNCEMSRKAVDREGNIGQTSVFPWLGILRVHVHQGGSIKIALSGIVLVKENYAIVNADDVAKLPKQTFQQHSKAMFIPAANEPWFCTLKDYMTHPEYEYSTLNTIALLELDPGEDKFYPMKPICWPPYSYNTSNQLYAVGYVDDNKLLEKSIYKLQYVEQQLCQEYYNRAGLAESKLTPTQYQCGFAANNKEDCIWENGMALISNTTGFWTFVGLSIRGPGCAAPARFIDILSFFSWIESATDLKEIDDYQDFRKSAHIEINRIGESIVINVKQFSGQNGKNEIFNPQGVTTFYFIDIRNSR